MRVSFSSLCALRKQNYSKCLMITQKLVNSIWRELGREGLNLEGDRESFSDLSYLKTTKSKLERFPANMRKMSLKMSVAVCKKKIQCILMSLIERPIKSWRKDSKRNTVSFTITLRFKTSLKKSRVMMKLMHWKRSVRMNIKTISKSYLTKTTNK